MNSRGIFRWALPILAVLALSSAGISVARSNLPDTAEDRTDPVLSPNVDLSPSPSFIGALGRVEPQGGSRRIAPERAGIVAIVNSAAGESVMARDMLFSLHDRATRLVVSEREAEVTSARARLADALAQTPLLISARDAAQARLAAAGTQVAVDTSRPAVVTPLGQGGRASRCAIWRPSLSCARMPNSCDAPRTLSTRAVLNSFMSCPIEPTCCSIRPSTFGCPPGLGPRSALPT